MNMRACNKTQFQKQGFSLIEVIVSIALFSIILTVALGGLLLVIDANRKAKAIKLVVNNLNLAMESMSRELRVGSNICDTEGGTGSSCNTTSLGSEQIFFTTDRGEDNSMFEIAGDAVFRRIGPNAAGNPALKLTGSDVTVDNLRFYIRGIGPGDDIQPSVVIVLNGHATQADQLVEFDIQTTVSQRKLEL